MERIEELLRDEFQRGGAPGAAPVEEMLARVARVRRRRAVVAGAGGGVAVVLAGAALIGPLGVGSGAPPGAEPELPAPLYSNQLLRTVFIDEDHGYVLQRRCTTTFPEGTAFIRGETPPTEHECEAQLLATKDGGRHWAERELPTDPGTPDKYFDPLGRSLAFWVDRPGVIAVAGYDNRYWTSADGGVTWTKASGRRAEGPAGTVGVVGPDERQVFLLPPPGAESPLGKINSKNPVVAATDGSFWRASPGGEPYVMVTDDRGANWEKVTVAAGAEPVNWVATVDGRTLFAAAGATILRSNDRGATWTEAAEFGPGERGIAGLLMPNGDLVVTEVRTGDLYRLAAGATTLERLTSTLAIVNYVYRTGEWLVAARALDQREDPHLESVVAVSPDSGTTWVTIQPER